MLSIGITVVTYIGVSYMRGWAVTLKFLVFPGSRSSHRVATPTGGGLVIVVATLAAVVLIRILSPYWDVPGLAVYLIAAAIVACVGWLDDLYSLPAIVRFCVQAAAALAIMYWVNIFRNIVLPGFDGIFLGWFGPLFTFLWIVGLINAYNFMDGIDGNAGGIGVAGGVIWTLAAWRLGEPLLAALGLMVAATCLGFLGHNWQPARIFMGDVGSTFLGFTFAVLPLLALHKSEDARLPVVGALIVGPCIWDAIYTFLSRVARRKKVFEAHRGYLYQRLATKRWPHWLGACLYMVLTVALGLCGLLHLNKVNTWGWRLLIVVAAIMVFQVSVVLVAERKMEV